MVDVVRVVDGATGVVLSERWWDPVSGLASGWPVYPGAGAVAGPVVMVGSGIPRWCRMGRRGWCRSTTRIIC